MNRMIREGFDRYNGELDLEAPVKVGLAKEKEELHKRIHPVRLLHYDE